MFIMSYGTQSDPWSQACAQHERGDVSTKELYAIAHDLFEGEALDDVLADIAHADLAVQDFIVQV